MKQALIEFYLEWYNNKLTDKEMADQYEMKESDLHFLTTLGARYLKEKEHETTSNYPMSKWTRGRAKNQNEV